MEKMEIDRCQFGKNGSARRKADEALGLVGLGQMMRGLLYRGGSDLQSS